MRKIPIALKYNENDRFESLAVEPWKHYVPSFHMIGNVYYIGDDYAGALLVDTGNGLILIDTGMATTAPYLIHNIYALGFRPEQVKIILHTHGHFDHMGATSVLKILSNAQSCMSRLDTDMFIDRPELVTFGTHTEMGWPMVQVDREIEDGDTILLGNTEIKCMITPGHTDGTISFTMNIVDGDKQYRAAMFGGTGVNTLEYQYLMDNFGTLNNRQKYFDSLDRLEAIEGVEVTLANHPKFNDTFIKQQQKLANPNGINPFYNPSEWYSRIARLRQQLMQLIENEQS